MVVSALIFALGLLGLATTSDADNCRVFPDDKAWPSEKDWNALNKTVSGRLVATVPIGSPCHDPNYDAEQCAFLQKNWRDPALQYILSCSLLFVDGD
jgi:hypothetical protein